MWPAVVAGVLILSGEALSLFQPDGRDCLWVKLDLSSLKRETVLRLPDTDCLGMRAAWTFDESRVALEIGDIGSKVMGPRCVTVTQPVRLVEVDLGSGTTASLPPPPYQVVSLGYDARNELVAHLTEHPEPGVLKRVTDRVLRPSAPSWGGYLKRTQVWQAGAWVPAKGRKIPPEPHAGDPAWAGSAPASGNQDPAYQTLGPRSEEALTGSTSLGVADVPPDLATVLDGAAGLSTRWVELEANSSDPRAVVRVFLTQSSWAHTPMVFVRNGVARLAPTGLPPGVEARTTLQSGWLMVSGEGEVGARLFELQTGSLVWSTDTACGVTFWAPRMEPGEDNTDRWVDGDR